VEEENPDAFVLGEVWEDASTKIAYNKRRRYLLGHELHGVMNYPFRTALLAYLRGGDAHAFEDAMESIRENYPPDAFYSCMNFLGTHDTTRILTELGAAYKPAEKAERAEYHLSPAERELGLARLKLAALILFTFPGSPTVYYGDEAAMEGWEDPFNRSTYPWGREDADMKAYFSLLGNTRKHSAALQQGVIRYLYSKGPLLVYAREGENEQLVTVVNASADPIPLPIPWEKEHATDILTGNVINSADGRLPLIIPPFGGLLLK
jgi:4-alpha-glucanotransferase